MATNTARDIIARSLRLLGVLTTGEVPQSNEATEALDVLNDMLDVWSNERLMIYDIVNNSFTLTSGVSSYTLGPINSGSTWESSQISRPLLTQKYSAFIRDADSDYPLSFYPNDRFQTVNQKSTGASYPDMWTSDGGYPISTIRLWPVPASSGLTFNLAEWAQIKKFCDLSTYANFPPGYVSAIAYNLAIELAPEYGKVPNEIIIDKARETKYNIKRANQTPVLMTPDSVLLGSGSYNIYGDA